MSTKAKKIDPPSDPDPTPVSSSDPAQEIQSAARSERKKAAAKYGRNQTILAGKENETGSSDENSQNSHPVKKNILGG